MESGNVVIENFRLEDLSDEGASYKVRISVKDKSKIFFLESTTYRKKLLFKNAVVKGKDKIEVFVSNQSSRASNRSYKCSYTFENLWAAGNVVEINESMKSNKKVKYHVSFDLKWLQKYAEERVEDTKSKEIEKLKKDSESESIHTDVSFEESNDDSFGDHSNSERSSRENSFLDSSPISFCSSENLYFPEDRTPKNKEDLHEKTNFPTDATHDYINEKYENNLTKKLNEKSEIQSVSKEVVENLIQSLNADKLETTVELSAESEKEVEPTSNIERIDSYKVLLESPEIEINETTDIVRSALSKLCGTRRPILRVETYYSTAKMIYITISGVPVINGASNIFETAVEEVLSRTPLNSMTSIPENEAHNSPPKVVDALDKHIENTLFNFDSFLDCKKDELIKGLCDLNTHIKNINEKEDKGMVDLAVSGMCNVIGAAFGLVGGFFKKDTKTRDPEHTFEPTALSN